MRQLVSVSRIGRSLGVHLILATQKPAGIVDDQIKSNTKFYISLKVQTAGDSKDVIGIESCGSAASDSRVGKVVAEEICWYWNREMNLITICYCVFRNKYGDFSDEKETNVDFSVIDKYIEM
jgi:hypothetical protein